MTCLFFHDWEYYDLKEFFKGKLKVTVKLFAKRYCKACNTTECLDENKLALNRWGASIKTWIDIKDKGIVEDYDGIRGNPQEHR